MKTASWRPLKNELKTVIGKGKIGKGRDIEMVIDTFDFIDRLPDKNIVRYSNEKIVQGDVKILWYELQKSQSEEGITSVGPKIASFYLRDLITVLHLQNKVSEKDQIFLQPVDTWVKQIANILRIDEKDPWKAREKILDKCKLAGVSPVQFNEGAWYLGTHSLDLLLEQMMDNSQS